jgi:hypothetical protein
MTHLMRWIFINVVLIIIIQKIRIMIFKINVLIVLKIINHYSQYYFIMHLVVYSIMYPLELYDPNIIQNNLIIID